MIRFRYRPAKTLLIVALVPAVLTLLAMLVHYLGDCSGGYKLPVACAFLPDDVGKMALDTLFFGLLFSMAWTPLGLAIVLVLEVFVRFWKRERPA